MGKISALAVRDNRWQKQMARESAGEAYDVRLRMKPHADRIKQLSKTTLTMLE